jgi:molecular chaperone DnaK (HSP70)
MRLGVDFGTTRIVVAAADRGNFPLVTFEVDDKSFDWLPPLVAVRGAERVYGWAAWNAQAQLGWTVVRSIKRLMEDAGPETRVEIAGIQVPLMELLVGLASEIRRGLVARYGDTPAFDVMLGVPANANSNQRFLTAEAFRQAGFSVLGLLNEPSAASIEFGHRQKLSGKVLVYDLGGGTFDVSLVELDARNHCVVATRGISTLGGDDFDRILAELAIGPELLSSLDSAALFRLEEECRRHKEALHPNSRRITIDLDVVAEGSSQAVIPVTEYYERCRPLIQRTVEATKRVATSGDIDALYVTGGGSELPLVARMLREEFGRKVKRSEYTRSATAIGLAIQADEATGYRLSEVFTRNFGVWRESDAGQRMIFDPIFAQGTRLPVSGDPPLAVSRTYHPVHNVGHFRYLEASQITDHGEPAGDIAVWDEIHFPFDPSLAAEAALDRVVVARNSMAPVQEIEERYGCDSTGGVTVTIRNLTSQYGREYRLGRWSGTEKVIKPSHGRRSRKAATP